jgi:4'-phosphopantetheinyl transferase
VAASQIERMTGRPAEWTRQPAFSSESEAAVHVWTVDLGRPPVGLDVLEDTLSADERARSRRFHFRRDQVDFVIARGALRMLVGHYLQRDPARIAFRYSTYGKPMLVLDRDSRLRFNLAHSARRAVYAISAERELGVDIEKVRPLVDMETIARRFFSADEYAALMSLPGIDQPIAFYRCWTRKEAYLKALGDGLARPLSEFDVSVLPTSVPGLIRVRWSPGDIDRWTLIDIESEPGFVGTLAVAGLCPTMQQWSWHRRAHRPEATGPVKRCA